jgi:protein-disulfide isomerase/uncharacterized membrane protein
VFAELRNEKSWRRANDHVGKQYDAMTSDRRAAPPRLTTRAQGGNIAAMLPRRAATVTAILSLVGAGIGATLAAIHRNLAASTGYTSFCNVRENINCDLVLSSEYAYFLGFPIAWWAVLTYAIGAAAAAVAMFSRSATRRREAAGLLLGLAVWAVAYSVYLAFISLVVLRTICLLCSALYLINAGLLVSTWVLFSATRTEGKTGARAKETWQWRTRLVVAGAALTVVVFLVFALREGLGRDPKTLSAEEVAQQYPEFHAWYTALPVAAVDDGGRHVRGGPAGVVIVEFSDFQCPHCARAYRDLKRVLPRFGSDVQVVFRHFPLDKSCNPAVTSSAHPYACLAAAASECAAAQGRFWEYHDVLFDNQSSFSRDHLLRYADNVGLERAQFVACLDSDAPREAVRRDIAAAEKLGITSTPTFLLNGRVLRGALESNKFEYAIRLERAAHRAGS